MCSLQEHIERDIRARGERLLDAISKAGKRADILDEVNHERDKQESKWGEQNHPNGTGEKSTPVAEIVRGEANAMVNLHYAFGLALQAKSATDRHAKEGTLTYADIFLEEVFEALAEDDPSKLRAELVQAAAVAVAWIEKIDRDEAKR